MHAARLEQRKQRQHKRHGQQHNGEPGIVRSRGHGAASAGPHIGGNPVDVPPRQQRQNGQRGHNPPRAPAHDARLQTGILLHARGDQGVHSRQRQRNSGTKGQRRKVSGVEKALPEFAILCPAPRGQHEGDDPVDDHQAQVRGNEINPPVPQVQPRLQLVPSVQVEQRGRDLQEEEDPLDGPAPHVGMNQVACGRGTDQPDREPDAHPADGAENHCDQHKEPGVLLEPAEQCGVVLAPGPVLRDHQKQPATHREVRHEHVKNGHQGNQQTGAKRNVPNGIVHADPPVPALDFSLVRPASAPAHCACCSGLPFPLSPVTTRRDRHHDDW